jgi:hypothetical protein
MLKSLDSLSDSEDSIKSVKQKKAPEPPPPSLLIPPHPPPTIKKEVKILKQDNSDDEIESVILKPVKKTISVQAPDVGIPIEKRTLNTKFKRIVCISDTHCKHHQFLTQGLIPDGDIL